MGDFNMDAFNNITKFQSTEKVTGRLLTDAILAVNALSEHLIKIPDKPRYWKANKALHQLYQIEP